MPRRQRRRLSIRHATGRAAPRCGAAPEQASTDLPRRVPVIYSIQCNEVGFSPHSEAGFTAKCTSISCQVTGSMRVLLSNPAGCLGLKARQGGNAHAAESCASSELRTSWSASHTCSSEPRHRSSCQSSELAPQTICSGLRECERRPYSEAGAFMAGVREQPVLMYKRIAQCGVNGGGYGALHSLIMADLGHLDCLPRELLARSAATQPAGDALPVPDSARV